MEKWDMKLVTPNFLLHMYEITQLKPYKTPEKEQPPVRPETYLGQHP